MFCLRVVKRRWGTCLTRMVVMVHVSGEEQIWDGDQVGHMCSVGMLYSPIVPFIGAMNLPYGGI